MTFLSPPVVFDPASTASKVLFRDLDVLGSDGR